MDLHNLNHKRSELLSRLKAWCGDIPERGDMNVEESYTREYSSHTEIKLTYEGEPGERIPAYLLLPRASENPLPGILAAHQCGVHCDLGKEQVVGKCRNRPGHLYQIEDQAYGLELVRQGFVVLAPDANKVGERYDPSLREQWKTASQLGREQNVCCCAPGGSWGPIRWKPVFDVMRAIDFLCSHPRVDPSRIGMIGHSLGADTILWAMPLEERIRVAVMSGGGILSGNPYGIPYEDILTLIAPRPFLEVRGTDDFGKIELKEALERPVDERMAPRRAVHDRASRIYGLLGAEDCLVKREFEGGHCFPEKERTASYAFLKTWLEDPRIRVSLQEIQKVGA